MYILKRQAVQWRHTLLSCFAKIYFSRFVKIRNRNMAEMKRPVMQKLSMKLKLYLEQVHNRTVCRQRCPFNQVSIYPYNSPIPCPQAPSLFLPFPRFLPWPSPMLPPLHPGIFPGFFLVASLAASLAPSTHGSIRSSWLLLSLHQSVPPFFALLLLSFTFNLMLD